MDANPHRDRRTSPEEAKKCSGSNRRWSSWAATAAADCVALSCCPCAALSLFTLAFVKVPMMVGKKCLGKMRRKKVAGMCDESAEGSGGADGDDDHWFMVGKDGNLTKEGGIDGTASFGFDDEARISARTEAERVLMELYQIGHLGFGRVSFTGIS